MNNARASTDTIFAPGRELDGGKYKLIRLLGSGGMGAVFEAENKLTRKRVAIKCLHALRALQPEASARLLREAEAASRVRHPHVVDVYDVGREGDSLFLVMEYLEGEPLTKLIARGGVPIHELIALLLPAMRGVAAAHRLGVVHRDIKPDNIFLAREADYAQPVPKVLDFGISKLSTTDSDHVSLTRSGSTVGTPRYMAYEQLNGASIDGRVDVYAFGVILYEALTGQPPYDAETYPQLVLKIAHGELTPPKQLRPELPSTLDHLVCWALERDREQRVPSIEQLIRELEPFATAHGLEAEMTIADQALVATPLMAAGYSSTVRSKTKPTETGPALLEKPRRGRLALIVSACLGMLALLLTAAWTWLRPSAREERGRVSVVPEPSVSAPTDAQELQAGAVHSAPEREAIVEQELPQPAAASTAPPPAAAEALPVRARPEESKAAASGNAKQRLVIVKAPSKPPAAVAPPPLDATSSTANSSATPAPKPQNDTAAPPTAAEPARPTDTSSPQFRVKVPQSIEF